MMMMTSRIIPRGGRNVIGRSKFIFKRNNHHTPPNEKKKLSGLRKLTQEYGYSGLGVYFALSLLDFPFCFLLVHNMGQEKIGYYEDIVKEWIGLKNNKSDHDNKQQEPESNKDGKNNNHHPSIWTEAVLAYGIHKSLIFIRLPLTLAITPKVVKTLRSWGWNVGTRSMANAVGNSLTKTKK